jgi:hypothetical protein
MCLPFRVCTQHGPWRLIRLPGSYLPYAAMLVILPFYFFLAVFFDCANALAVGAPLLPTILIFSPDPAAMRFFLALMFAYSPGFFITFFLAS